MKVTIYPPTSEFLLDRFKVFTSDLNGKDWQDLYNSILFLKVNYPEAIFKQEPYIYNNLERKTSGLIFLEEKSDELYYVY